MIDNDTLIESVRRERKLTAAQYNEITSRVDVFLMQHPLGKVSVIYDRETDTEKTFNISERLRRFGVLTVYVPTQADTIHVAQLYKDKGFKVRGEEPHSLVITTSLT